MTNLTEDYKAIDKLKKRKTKKTQPYLTGTVLG